MGKLRLSILSVIMSLTALVSSADGLQQTAVSSSPSFAADSIVHHALTIKTNAVGWGMAMVNAAVEYEFYPRWSVEVPVYYSCWNYFGGSTRFRNLAIQPEFKRYFGRDDMFSVGFHFGFSYYNWHYGGDYRYQTHRKRSPMGGAGFSFNYRRSFGSDKRWGLELSLGVGAYLNEYDRYKMAACDCDPNDLSHYVDGRCTCMNPEFVRTAFVGIDKFCVSVTYTFDIKIKK